MQKIITWPANDLSKINEVILRSGLSKTSIYRNIKDGTFPAPVKIGKRAVAWRTEDLEKWLSERPYSLLNTFSGVKS
jgi:prophage regulatory protein